MSTATVLSAAPHIQKKGGGRMEREEGKEREAERKVGNVGKSWRGQIITLYHHT